MLWFTVDLNTFAYYPHANILIGRLLAKFAVSNRQNKKPPCMTYTKALQLWAHQ